MDRIDWNALWKKHWLPMNKNHSVDFWDDFAPTFRRKDDPGMDDPYIAQFYEFSGFLPGDTIFDMGCASGVLAIPFAQQGHEVWAADFSPRMLDYLMLGAEEAGVADRIHPILLDWNEDWSVRDLPKCDVVIASRSIVFEDLTEALKKLESVAKRKVCIGAWDTPSPHYDRGVAKAIGYERPGYGCQFYILNELLDRDLFPELRVIRHSMKRSGYDSREAIETRIRNSFQYGLTEEQEQKLRDYLDRHILRCETPERISYQLEGSELTTIAHISWDVARNT
ncbi:MAG: class I SAM-dependent methyltransferase [Mogibacterium sp.]|nr:class I SAM-dependent methyltransferase [Mogibacterium sp.]